MQTQRWSKERAQAWAQTQPWWVGCNFIPSTACNQLEMWQAETFDPATIERELGWAAQVGMNGVRVYLHDLAWQADPTGFKSRIDTFLELADQAGIRTVFVLFDDCWFPPVPGPQPDPVPGVHNSRWAQGPGHRVVRDRKQWPRLQRYVEDIVGSFREDERIGMWDLYNEPGNALLPLASLPNHLAMPRLLAPLFRHFILPSPSLALLQLSFVWARSVDPAQPLTAGIWAPIPRLNRFQLASSDVLTFHHYLGAESLAKQIHSLKRRFDRPVICTEWLARPVGSRVESHLPIFKDAQVGCFCWGLVAGRTQTIHRWRDQPGTPTPELWHHDLLHRDGSPFDQEEVDTFRKLTAPG